MGGCNGVSLADTKVVVITGPTASGKTALALEIAKRFQGEIINADSVQVYRGMDIGSSKPTKSQLEAVKHHLLSFVEPTVRFDAGMYCKHAAESIAEIQGKSKLPIICGGTGMYITALLNGLIESAAISEEAIEKVQQHEELGRSLFEWLEKIDPLSSAEIKPTDNFRVRRALLHYLSTGQSVTEARKAHSFSEQKYSSLVICLNPERSRLYERINSRVLEMLRDGFLDEVKLLHEQYGTSSPALGAIGYRHLSQYLSGALGYEQMVELLQRDTRRFAKRQNTWWSNRPRALGWKEFTDSEILEFQETGTNTTDKLCAVITHFLEGSGLFKQNDLTTPGVFFYRVDNFR